MSDTITADPWFRTTLGKVIEATGGVLQTGPLGSQLHASDYSTVWVPLIMPTNLGDNVIREDGIARVNAEDAARLRRHALREGDVVFSRRVMLGDDPSSDNVRLAGCVARAVLQRGSGLVEWRSIRSSLPSISYRPLFRLGC